MRRLKAEGLGGGGRGRGHFAGATEVSILQLPYQLLVLHGQTLVHHGLLLEGLVQHRLLRRQLPVMQPHNGSESLWMRLQSQIKALVFCTLVHVSLHTFSSLSEMSGVHTVNSYLDSV